MPKSELLNGADSFCVPSARKHILSSTMLHKVMKKCIYCKTEKCKRYICITCIAHLSVDFEEFPWFYNFTMNNERMTNILDIPKLSKVPTNTETILYLFNGFGKIIK